MIKTLLTRCVVSLVLLASCLNLLINSQSVLASGEKGSAPPVKLENPLAFDSITAFLNGLVTVLLYFAVPVIMLFIIYAGFLYLTAQGNPQKLQTAHQALLYALIGGAIVLGAFAISQIIETTLNPFCEGGRCVPTS